MAKIKCNNCEHLSTFGGVGEAMYVCDKSDGFCQIGYVNQLKNKAIEPPTWCPIIGVLPMAEIKLTECALCKVMPNEFEKDYPGGGQAPDSKSWVIECPICGSNKSFNNMTGPIFIDGVGKYQSVSDYRSLARQEWNKLHQK